MKIIYKGNIFNPTGIATVNREIVKALLEMGYQVQASDIWHSGYEFNMGLEILNKPIDPNEGEVLTIFADYPQYWKDGYGKLIGHFVHEGTKLFEDWVHYMNRVEKIWVPSRATYNLFKWNGVTVPMKIIPHGISEIYKPKPRKKKTNEFVFLSVNSWTGKIGDRKGTDLLIKAFDEEFRGENNVKLLLKISTFFRSGIDYISAIYNIIKNPNPNILINDKYVPEEDLIHYYQNADCFVSPTRGEAFGLTIANAMACGLPVIVTKDINSGHMDYCKNKKSVLWIDAPEVRQGDREFYVEGNMLAEPDINSLKKQMRFAYENRDKLRKLALKDSELIRKELSWKKTAEEIIKWAKE